MIPPEIQSQISGYSLCWKAEQLTAKVSRLHVHSDGRVTGELQLCHKNDTGDVILLPASMINFSAAGTRTKMAKDLKAKYDYKIEWLEVFDFLGHRIQELARAGDNVQEVWLQDDSPAPEQLLGKILYRGVQNIIFGEKGVNKSTLCYALAICLDLPWYDNPLSIPVPKLPVKTLILDWETDEYIFRYYLGRMKKGMNIPECQLYYRRCSLPLIQEAEAIQKYVADIKAEVLLIDSLGAAAGGERGELKGSESALLFNSVLRKLKVTSLIIAQTSKDTESHKKTIYGSTFFHYYARNVFELCKSHDDDGDEQHLALFHRDCNLGKKSPPMGFRLNFDDTQNTIQINREPVSVAEFSDKVSASAKILNFLKAGAASPKDIMSACELSRGNTDMSLKRLKDQHKVVKLESGQWGLSTV